RTARWEKARINDVEVIQVVRLAICIQDRCRSVTTESEGPILVWHSSQRDPLADVCIEMDDLFRAVRMLKQALELRLKALVPFIIVGFVTQLDLAFSRYRDAIVWIGQIL